ncbi:MAG: thiopurine S-methyltransferase [Deltaproteobacteria bacterium]|nr:thiopurine S-methyltransferase [Deltaproteobacteria bacterium]MBT4184839.1 thiopurine S-methyltransferase [Deltaproteobacteria bacterium]MBT5087284.1 thiopurine S-methyltransferase [Deltaproteobacteria bacterium]MBT5485868.1 thiopurine S-methyltransferase [Deltaproteobacteria bacterium]MBT5833284.1 thiopurine S-methyltransferase [Deltaproteobacteria bacterium]
MNQWESRWQEGRIGFHLPEVNSYLLRYFDKLLTQDTESVFVPLCGKTLDLPWLARRTKKVVGIELVHKAVQEFFKENKLTYSIQKSGKLNLFSNDNIDLFQGDFFDLNKAQTSPFEAIYDRASIVAFDRSERQRYVNHLMSFLKPGGRILLITLEYDQNKMTGPPFSVPTDEIEWLYAPYGILKLLETSDIFDERFRKNGLDGMLERVFQFIKQ